MVSPNNIFLRILRSGKCIGIHIAHMLFMGDKVKKPSGLLTLKAFTYWLLDLGSNQGPTD